ncbi:MAG: type II toxin-antitoxin system VapC family toxin [Proteobacteria bacterium]|nr:type II toxin-antitoxin system VapC family toxin [Pseudomonadota bacterium]
MFILDCSVCMAWCFEGENSQYSDVVLECLKTQTALVPQLWHLEIINVLLVAERKKRITSSTAEEFLTILQSMNIQTDSIVISLADHKSISLARDHQLSTYDMTYLALAQREQLPIATNDNKLKQVVKSLNLFFDPP